VLGADSTASVPIFPGPGLVGLHYYNHNQKLFEIGTESTAGLLTWGLGNLESHSYSHTIADLADKLLAKPPSTFADVVQEWVDLFWKEYDACAWVKMPGARHQGALCAARRTTDHGDAIGRSLSGRCSRSRHGNVSRHCATPTRTAAEEQEFQLQSQNLVAGFCIAGYWLPDRTPKAFVIVFDPVGAKPTPSPLVVMNQGYAWGAPNLIRRLVIGLDDMAKGAILRRQNRLAYPATWTLS
jgi:hypothetical protein